MTDLQLHCCKNLNIIREEIKLERNDFEFKVHITYCTSCGSIKYGTTGIQDGKKIHTR